MALITSAMLTLDFLAGIVGNLQFLRSKSTVLD